MNMTTPIDPAWREELKDWRGTLSKEEDAFIDSMIRVKGEEYVLSILGHQ